MKYYIICLSVTVGVIVTGIWLKNNQDMPDEVTTYPLLANDAGSVDDFFTSFVEQEIKPEPLTIEALFDVNFLRDTNSKKAEAGEWHHKEQLFMKFAFMQLHQSQQLHVEKVAPVMPQTGFAANLATQSMDLSRVLTMNKFIPAILYTEIRSWLPSSKVIAKVEQDISGFHGREILIPKGSDIIGTYQPLQHIGDRRLAIEWYRIITPHGTNIKISAEVADQDGVAGISGKVDQRLKDRYGQASLFATINALGRLSIPTQDIKLQVAADSFTKELGTLTAQALREGLNVTPIVHIKKGSRLIISPVVDVVFHKRNVGDVVVQPMSKAVI